MRTSTAVRRRRRRKKKVRMEKKMISLVQNLKAVRKRKGSRKRTNRMLTDSNSWNGMTLLSAIDSSCSLHLFVSALEDFTIILYIVPKDPWCKKVILASRANQHTSQYLCYIG